MEINRTLKLAIVGIYLFVGNSIVVRAGGPSPVTKVVEYDLKPEKRKVVIETDSCSIYKIDYTNYIEKKFNSDFLKKQMLYKDYGLSELNRTSNSIMRSSTSNSNLRKTDMQGIVENLAKSYIYKIDFQSVVQNYQDLLFHGFSEISNNLLEDSSFGHNGDSPNFFGNLYHSMIDFVNYNPDFGKFYIDSSLGFGYTGVKLSYNSIYGTISSSWNMDCNKLSLKIRIPLNSSESASDLKREFFINTVSK